MVIYIVRYSDYDGEYSVGYFTDAAAAELCCYYEMRTNPSPYCTNPCKVERYEFNDTDYAGLLAELYEKERAKKEAELKKIEEKERKQLAILKAKYEQ